jgi:hypothetical protein
LSILDRCIKQENLHVFQLDSGSWVLGNIPRLTAAGTDKSNLRLFGPYLFLFYSRNNSSSRAEARDTARFIFLYVAQPGAPLDGS